MARDLRIWTRHWPLIAGMSAQLIPSLITLGHQNWSTEAGAQGPIILATGLWLLAHAWSEVDSNEARAVPVSASITLTLSLIAYVFGRAYDFVSMEIAAAITASASVIVLRCGSRALRALWFPLGYLCFLIPLPGRVLNDLTGPLKSAISAAATALLRAGNYPVAHAGATIYVAQYQLLVEDACAGLNSLLSLTALSLFYIYLLHRNAWRRGAALLTVVIPAAVFANFVRVVILILLTYHAGNQVAQSYLHEVAGLVLFSIALLSLHVVDGAIGCTWARRP